MTDYISIFAVSHKFGFGLMDGGAMVDKALNWSTAPPQLIYHSAQQDPEM